MPPSLSLTDEHVVQRTRGLVAYLKELVEQSFDQVRDTADNTTIWLDGYQDHFAGPDAPELLEIRCPPVPEWPQPVGAVVERYRRLEALGRRSVELSDTHELLFGVGLLATSVERRPVRRHLLTCPVELSSDMLTETVRLLPSLTSGFRLDDRDFLSAEDGFTADREIGAVLAEQAAYLTPLAPGVGEWFDLWRRRCWQGPLSVRPAEWVPVEGVASPTLAFSPALLLRPRTRSRLVDFYGRLASDLEQPGVAAPLGLAQLVVPMERVEKLRLLEQSSGAALLGDADPLLPLPSNAEQRRILEVLRSDTAAVIQGPPGTGKTHTIANLICALLADGQRVLVTSEKGQALRVLKDKLPDDVRNLCVLATGLRRGADDELDRSITALSELQVSTDVDQLTRATDRLATRRGDLLEQRKALLLDLQIVREDQYSVHHGASLYSGTLVDIVRAIDAGRATHEWIGTLPPTATELPPLTDAEASTLLALLRTTNPERASRGRQRLPSLDVLPEPLEVNAAFAHLNEVDELLGADRSAVAPLLDLDADLLAEITPLIHQAADGLAAVGLPELTSHWGSDDWRLRAACDRFAHRNPEYWTTLRAELKTVIDDPDVQAASAATTVSTDPGADPVRMLGQARRLRVQLLRRHWIRRYLPAQPYPEAADLLSGCTVEGLPPDTVTALDAAIFYLSAEATVNAAVRAWSMAGNPVVTVRLSGRLAQLRDIERSAAVIDAFARTRDYIEHLLRRSGIRYSISTTEQWDRTVRAVQASPMITRARAAQERLDAIASHLTTVSYDPDVAPEILQLLTAIRQRDIAAYASNRARVGKAILERDRERQCATLTGRLRAQHPQLAGKLAQDPHHPAWSNA